MIERHGNGVGGGYGGGATHGRGGGAGQGFGDRRHLHRAAAVAGPVGLAQPSRILPTAVGTSAEPQAVAYVAKAIRADQCKACAACQSACSQGAISVDGIVTVDEALCTACGDCVDACMFDVLALRPR